MKKLLTMLLLVSGYSAYAECGEYCSNMYVGTGAGAGWNDIASPAATFRLHGGYKLDPYWAFELGTTGITQPGGAVNEAVQFYDLSLKGTFPLTDMFAVALQVGGAYGSPGVIQNAYTVPFAKTFLTNSYSISNAQAGAWDFMYGAGVEFNMTKQVSLTLMDYGYYGSVNALGGTNAALLGLNFRF